MTRTASRSTIQARTPGGTAKPAPTPTPSRRRSGLPSSRSSTARCHSQTSRATSSPASTSSWRRATSAPPCTASSCSASAPATPIHSADPARPSRSSPTRSCTTSTRSGWRTEPASRVSSPSASTRSGSTEPLPDSRNTSPRAGSALHLTLPMRGWNIPVSRNADDLIRIVDNARRSCFSLKNSGPSRASSGGQEYGGGHEQDGSQRREDADPRHQLLWRAGERLQRLDCGREGRQDHPHPPDALRLEVQEGRPEPLEDGSAGEHLRTQHEDPHPPVQPRLQEACVFPRPHSLPDDARRLRPRRGAQPAEPRREQVQAHLLGEGARRHHQRDGAYQGQVRPHGPALPVRPARREQGLSLIHISEP